MKIKVRIRVSGELLCRVNIRKKGPFKGQKTFECHYKDIHYLTHLITEKNSVYCNCCNGKLSSAQYFCSICNYNHCDIQCKKNRKIIRRINENVSYDKRYYFKSLQHQDHLIKAKILYKYDIFKCFCCLKEKSQNQYIFYCTKCDFRICEKCKITEERGLPWQFHSCWHEHPLTLCKTKGREDYKNILKNKYEEEENEEQKKEKEKKIIKKSYSNKKENFSKAISRTQTLVENPNENNESKKKLFLYLKSKKEKIIERYELEYELFFVCNHCGKQISRKKYAYYCTACDFYICLKCYKDHFFFIGRDRENVVNVFMKNERSSPKRCLCVLEDDLEKNIFCLYCRSHLDKNKFNYYCSNCNSSFCNKCQKIHKCLFCNDILVFDGYINLLGEKEKNGIVYKRNNEINYEGYWINNKYKFIDDIPHSHSKYYKHGEFHYICECDICLKKCNIFDTGILCSECHLVICEPCVIEINRKGLKKKKNSDHIHNLSIEKYSKKKNCSLCKKDITGIFFSCKECNWDKNPIYSFFYSDYYCCLECFDVERYNLYL